MFTQFLIAIPAFLVVITVLVAVHEFGHYWVAKKVGMKVERFSIGFGQPIMRKFFKANETEFVVSTLPLGGYVKILDERLVEQIADEDKHRTYNSKSPWQRIVFLLAGPLANFIFAILVFWLLFIVGVSAFKPLVAPIENSIAAEAGLLAGDEIVAVNGKPVASFEEFVTSFFAEIIRESDANEMPAKAVKLEVKRGTQRKDVFLTVSAEQARLDRADRLLTELGVQNWQPPIPAVIDQVSANSPAADIGLRKGDVITELDGVKIDNWRNLVSLIQQYPDQKVDIVYQRQAMTHNATINVGERQSDGQSIGIIGVSVAIPENYADQLQTRQKYGVFAGLQKSLYKTWDMCVLSLNMFKQMLQGNVSIKNLSGPVSIAEQAGYSVQSGFDRYVAFFALISIALGIVNLLPIPMLDGGQIVLNLLELGKGSPVSERIEMVYQQLGFLCIVLLMGLAIFNDIERLIS